MSTSNFHNVNASKIFAVQVTDYAEYEELVANLESVLTDDVNISDPYELRSYPSKIVGSLTSGKCRIYAVVRSGYYADVNLDWIMDYDGYTSARDYEDMIDCDDTLPDDAKSNLKELAHLEAEYLRNKMENIFLEYGTPLVVRARFSNGETIYGESK